MVALLLPPLLGLLTACLPTTPRPNPTVRSELEQMVAHEAEFAAYGAQYGVPQSFSQYLAQTWLFDKGQFRTGQEIYGPRPASPMRILWRPVHAGMAASGDLGFTTGPWELRPTGATSAPVAFGDFVTVWQQTAAGRWEAVYDGGVEHKAFAKPPKARWPRQYPTRQPASPDTARFRQSLLAAETDFSRRAQQSLRQAYLPVLAAAPDVRLLHEGELPYTGTAARALAENLLRPVQLTLFKAGVSAAGDLGYAFGYQESQPERGYYLHLWRRSGNQWQLIMGVLSPALPGKSE